MSRADNKKRKKSKKPISQQAQEQQKEAKAKRDILTSLGEADRHLNVLKANIHGFLKIGHDLFLTSNDWLFTEDVRVDGARQAEAIDDLLVLRTYMFKLQQALYKVITALEATKQLTADFRKLSLEELYVKYVSELIPIISSFGEELTEILAIADNLTQKHDTALQKVLPSELYDSMKHIFKEAAENREAMREVNLTKAPEAQPEEVPTMEIANETPTQSTEQSENPTSQTAEEASQPETTSGDNRPDEVRVTTRDGSPAGCSTDDEVHSQVCPDAQPTEEPSNASDTSEPSTVKVD